MARKGRRNNSNNQNDNIAESTPTRTYSSTLAPIAGSADVVVGFTPSVFAIDLSKEGHKAPWAFRTVIPYASFLGGWTNIANDLASDQNADPEFDLDGFNGVNYVYDASKPVSDPLYAQSFMSFQFLNDTWPTLNSMFNLGLGSRAEVTLPSFIRYIARMTRLVNYATSITNILRLRDMGNTMFPDPAGHRIFIKFLAESGFEDEAQIKRFHRLVDQIRLYPMFPGIVQEINRMLAPFQSVDLGELLHIPCALPVEDTEAAVGTWDLTSSLDAMTADVDYLMLSDMSKVVSTIASFIPITLDEAGFLESMPIGIDPVKSVGFYNSNPEMLLSEGNETSPRDDTGLALLIHQETTGDISTALSQGSFTQKSHASSDHADHGASTTHPFFLTLNPQPTAAEVLSTSIYIESRGMTPDWFSQLTPHIISRITCYDDLSNLKVFGTSGVADSDVQLGAQLMCRWLGSSARPQLYDPQFNLGDLDLPGVMVAVRAFTALSFNTPALQQVYGRQIGRSIKFTRDEVKSLFLS